MTTIVTRNLKDPATTTSFDPIQKGSILRNNRAGSKLVVVTDIDYDSREVLMVSYGTHKYGVFTPAAKKRTAGVGKLLPNKNEVIVAGGRKNWLYKHVDVHWAEED